MVENRKFFQKQQVVLISKDIKISSKLWHSVQKKYKDEDIYTVNL